MSDQETERDEMRRLAADMRHREPRRPPPKKLRDAVNDLLARSGYARELATSEMNDVWRRAAGERIAGKSRACQVRNGALEVIVANSAVLQEVTFMKRQLIQKLLELDPRQRVRDLRLRVGEVS